MSAPTIEISFGKSTSQYYKDAVKQALKFEQHEVKGEGRQQRHLVPIAIDFDNPDELNSMLHLLNTVRSWRSTIVRFNDKQVVSKYGLEQEIAGIADCYGVRKATALIGDDYCLGKDAPDSDPTCFGCRQAKGVSLLTREYETYQGRQAKWYSIGALSEDATGFLVDKPRILELVRSSTTNELCVACPAFSWARVEETVAVLPDEIDLSNNAEFEIVYSRINPQTPLGITRKRQSYVSAIPLGFGDHNEDSESEAVREVPTTRYSDVAAQDRAIREIQNVVQLPLTHPEYFEAVGVSAQKGVLLYGPPGNGKTLIARAVAGESDAHLEKISGPEILSKWVGQSEENLRGVFDRARQFAPSIVLIDEIDSIAPTRDQMTHQHDVSLISQLLVLLDGFEDRGQVSVIATTNRFDSIDPAIRRAGRFDYHIKVRKPDRSGRLAILAIHLSRMTIDSDLDKGLIADETDGFSGADLAALCREAGLQAIRRGLSQKVAANDLRVAKSDISRALEEIRGKRDGDGAGRL